MSDYVFEYAYWWCGCNSKIMVIDILEEEGGVLLKRTSSLHNRMHLSLFAIYRNK